MQLWEEGEDPASWFESVKDLAARVSGAKGYGEEAKPLSGTSSTV
jgi:hypothetical protein